MRAQLEDSDLEAIARRVAELLAERKSAADHGGYLAPEAAARYLGVSKKRIYDLKSMRAIEPDGFDGRTPLWKRTTLDAYAQSSRVAP